MYIHLMMHNMAISFILKPMYQLLNLKLNVRYFNEQNGSNLYFKNKLSVLLEGKSYKLKVSNSDYFAIYTISGYCHFYTLPVTFPLYVLLWQKIDQSPTF